VTAEPAVLRGPSPWALPCWLVAVVLWVLGVLALMWAAGAASSDRPVGYIVAVVAGAAGAGALTLRRGTRVLVADGTISDQVMFRTVSATPQSQVRAAHVAAGPWRWYVLELEDGSVRTLVGAGPLQVPTRWFDREGVADLADLDVLMGPVPSSPN
jgi:hypothetical protein